MGDVLVRNLRPETKRALVERARHNGRSLQAELTDLLERAAAEPVAPTGAVTLDLNLGRSDGESDWDRGEIYAEDR